MQSLISNPPPLPLYRWKPQVAIKCPPNPSFPNDGLRLTDAKSDADFRRLSSNGIYEAVEPWKVVVVSIDKNEAISMAESRDGRE
ncbi:hypothetical protein Goarm_016051 [Gossypium armourianum]|uniref:Uncharacterized protein n=1 Tax=Gossypium armourianum TaxID=34283 RepID=A0A7J9JDR4_9ROSI|nr:hypothetical protein [Gossypium armourianum]